MSELQMQKIGELLNEEKWTRATLNNYSIGNFEELDALIDALEDEDAQDEAKELCDEHLTHTKNSIIALYIAGIVALSRQQIDDSNLVKLISIFSDNHKWTVVEYLCNRILDFGENKFALRTLSECYDHENETEKKYAVWERLIKVDYEEADIVRHLAEKKEEEGEIDAAVDFYKKAIHRYINKRLFTQVKDIWQKLIEYIPQEGDFFFHIERKVAKTISEERAGQLLEALYAEYRAAEDWDKSITILKRILGYDSKNLWARKEIVECFKQQYKDHSHLDEYIRLSNLNQNWRNVHDAINDFEKHISFDAGNFVCHRTWGVGRIREIKGDSVMIDFARKRGHEMSLKMAVSALGSLSKDHIWVLKVVWPKDKLHDKIKKDIPWALKTVIKSFDNAANMKQIKAELVDSVLSQGEWSTWSTQARQVLKTDPSFGNLPDKVDYFVVRDTPISFEEKTFNRFRAEKHFFGRLKIMREFLKDSDPESDYFGEMFGYFAGFLKAYNQVNEQVVASYLIISRLIREYPFLNPGFSIKFKELIQEIGDIEGMFQAIDDSDLKKDFLDRLKKSVSNWPDYFVRLFPHYLTRYIPDELESRGHDEKLKELFSNLVDQYRDKREAFIWVARNIDEKSWNEDYDISYEKVLIGMVHLLDITFREISNKREVAENRKLNRQIQTFLLKEKKLEEYIAKSDEDSINRLFTLINDVKELDPSVKIELKHTILERFPSFKFYGEKVTEVVSRGLIVTRKTFEAKKQQLQHINDVEMKETSKEIGAAIELGDLKENAEYKAGKEKQELLNIQMQKLKDEIDRAVIFDPADRDTSKISFATKVTLENLDTKKKETYSFFGPWESNPNENIISYLSPFGGKLWNHKEGEDLEFEINERVYHYSVLKIEAAEMP
ncbi:transcription elongation factor GreA [Sediminispirochaeta bajacaliforniensis]|uniref:transcription elongation factor GreA n=1 Tax=Sediminispirochaeta bajacaliforniensis TaxID=148 RepID=UPI0003807502|nr:transcription elongation factor GreA [Sediminispirochaeta bajacaliforniensis]